MFEDGKFTITIRLGNDAMSYCEDIAGALRAVAAKLYQGQTSGPVKDENGNTVGHFLLDNEGA